MVYFLYCCMWMNVEKSSSQLSKAWWETPPSGLSILYWYSTIIQRQIHHRLTVNQPEFLPSTGAELRAGRSPRREQEDPERSAPRRERPSRPRQVQDPASDPPGQHQAEGWWVWGLVETSETWRSLPNTSWRPCPAMFLNEVWCNCSHTWF